MASRGNEPATVPVRPHFFVGAALVAAAALAHVAGLAWAAHALLAGLTLFAQGIAFWYLPSFAKRGVVLRPVAAYAGPFLLPAAAALQAAGARSAARWLAWAALALFALVLLASALAGPRWRGGVPFWRAPGRHRAGDRAAALTFALSALWMPAAPLAPVPFLHAWAFALALFALAALAHLLPRSQGRPLAWAPFLLGLPPAALGALMLQGGTLGGHLLLAALLLPAASLARGFAADKPAGPRLRDARAPLAAAGAALVVGIALLLLDLPRGLATRDAAPQVLLAALALAMAGLSLLALPVLFNQRPDARWIRPGAWAALAGAALAALAPFAPVPAAAPRVALALALVAWLATLAPLRHPRRECAPP